MERQESREPKKSAGPQLGSGDRWILDVVEKAQAQYRRYLAVAEVGSLARLSQARPDDRPPRTDLPLTLIVH